MEMSEIIIKTSYTTEIPIDWEVSLLDDLTKRGSGHTPDKAYEEYYNGGIKWISLADSYLLSKIEKGYLVKSWITTLSHKIDNETTIENIHYYGYLRNLDESEFEFVFLEKTQSENPFTQYEKELSVQILYNSRITWLKYQLFKIGAFSFLAAIALSVIFLPIIQWFK